MDAIFETCNKLQNNIKKIILGKEEEIEKILIAMLCKGHILLEDIPGTGKTTLAKSLAKSINCDFKRIQFTPDLLPSDITGINFYNQKQGEFTLKKGPVFTNILLADEINRATPRTQSSLLECMEEHQVTIDGALHVLSQPFFVIATQNPIETLGTFKLPEAQLDRFFMKLRLGYPNTQSEMTMLEVFENEMPLNSLKAVVTQEEWIKAQDEIKHIKVSQEIRAYIVAIAKATRVHKEIKLGLSPRGSIALLKGAKAYAALRERDYVLPDDVKAVCRDIVEHRLQYQSFIQINKQNDIIGEILDSIKLEQLL